MYCIKHFILDSLVNGIPVDFLSNFQVEADVPVLSFHVFKATTDDQI